MAEEVFIGQEEESDSSPKRADQMTDKELLAKMKKLSNKIYMARDEFIAHLPEVRKRRLWDNGRFHSVFHYAKVMACLREETTHRVFNMYGRIKNYPRILSLFLEGKVGWAKIEIVAKELNSKNAYHFARRLQSNTTSTLKRLIKNIRKKRKTEDKEGEDNNKNNKNKYERNVNSGDHSSSGQEPKCTKTVMGGTAQTKANGGANQNESPGNAQSSSGQNTFGFPQGGNDSAASVSQTSGADRSTHDKSAAPCEACGHVQGQSVKRGRSRRLVPMMVTTVVRDMYERLLSKWKRKDRKVKMNEVAERVMLAALEMGVDLTFDCGRGPTDGSAKASKSGDANATKTTSVKKSKKPTPASRTRAWWKRPYVQIVNYDVATGAFLTKTYDGWERVCEQDIAYREALRAAPVDLKQLRLEAKDFAAEYIRKHVLAGKDITDYIPEFVRYYIELRSQGFCEFPGCKNRACTIHHLKRFCLDPDCDPDGLINLCDGCEKLFHDGVVKNEFGPFKDFIIGEDYIPKTKSEKERAKVDERVQKWRQAYKERSTQTSAKEQRRARQNKGPSLYPIVRRGGRKMRFGKGK